MIWKLGKLQSAYNELRLDVGTVLTLHKSFVFERLNPNAAQWIIPSLY